MNFRIFLKMISKKLQMILNAGIFLLKKIIFIVGMGTNSQFIKNRNNELF